VALAELPSPDPNPVAGIYPALVTPLLDGRVDRDACGRLVEHVLRGNVHGVLVLGSSGEGAALTPRARRSIVEIFADALGGRRPYVVGIITSSVEAAISEVRHAASCGAVAVLAAPPHYGPIDDESVMAFYRALALASDVPVISYNIPAFTGVPIRPAVVESLAREGAIVGIKDSSRDFDYFQDVLTRLRDRPEFRGLTGTDSLLVPAQVSGAHGGITIGANLVPEWCVGAWTAAQEGRWAEARRFQERLVQLGQAIRQGTFPAGMKAALSLLGICSGEVAVPGRALAADQRSQLAFQLGELGVYAAAGSPPVLADALGVGGNT
jgi:4-hydroxy-tetrahydrodipicolinate synthase